VAVPALTGNKSLSSSISNTLKTADWKEGTYDIELDKYDLCQSGVSSVDIVLVMRHILGLRELDSNAKLVAADYNEDGKVSAADLIGMRKTVLGTEDCQDDSKWRFFKNSLNENNLIELDNLSEHDLSYTINQFETQDINIIALKKGDVNQSAIDNESTKSKKIQLVTDDISLRAGNEYEVKFTAKEALDFVSGDFNFQYGPELTITGFSSDPLDIQNYHYHIGDNKAKLIWYGEENASFDTDEQVLTMLIRSNVNGQLSDFLSPSSTDIELHLSLDSKKSIRSQISFDKNPEHDYNLVSSFSVQMYNDQLNIESNDAASIIKSVEVFNMTGQRVYANMNVNQTELNTTLQGNHTEILAYRILSSNGEIQVRKTFAY